MDRTEEQTGRSPINYGQDKERVKPWSKMRKLPQNFQQFFLILSKLHFYSKKGVKVQIYSPQLTDTTCPGHIPTETLTSFCSATEGNFSMSQTPKVDCESFAELGLTFCFHCLKKVQAQIPVCFQKAMPYSLSGSHVQTAVLLQYLSSHEIIAVRPLVAWLQKRFCRRLVLKHHPCQLSEMQVFPRGPIWCLLIIWTYQLQSQALCCGVKPKLLFQLSGFSLWCYILFRMIEMTFFGQ